MGIRNFVDEDIELPMPTGQREAWVVAARPEWGARGPERALLCGRHMPTVAGNLADDPQPDSGAGESIGDLAVSNLAVAALTAAFTRDSA